MAIRPQIGARVVFTSWYHLTGEPAPPSPWTGTVVGCNQGIGRRRYAVKRDADGETTMLGSSSLAYAEKECE